MKRPRDWKWKPKSKQQSKPARHTEAAPHACVGELYLSIDPNPLRPVGRDVIVVHCIGCGHIVAVWGVLPAPELVNNDDQDDCA